MNISCPYCHQPHALFWECGSAGKPALKYRCNSQRQIKHLKNGDIELNKVIQSIVIGTKGSIKTKPYESDPTIPEVWTRAKIKQAQSDSQSHFPI